MFRLDKNAFKKQSFADSDNQLKYWLGKTATERVNAAIYLQSISYNFDPEHPPLMDKTFFSKRKRD